MRCKDKSRKEMQEIRKRQIEILFFSQKEVTRQDSISRLPATGCVFLFLRIRVVQHSLSWTSSSVFGEASFQPGAYWLSPLEGAGGSGSAVTVSAGTSSGTEGSFYLKRMERAPVQIPVQKKASPICATVDCPPRRRHIEESHPAGIIQNRRALLIDQNL